jgi:hypothetical protein
MPIIPYKASNFGRHWGAHLAGSHDLPVTWAELVWSAITVGKPGIAYLLAHGWHSTSDVVVRSHTVYANLRQDKRYIKKSSLYNALDPTEKGATSYFMGMMVAKIVGARLLQTPWLFHLSTISALGGTTKLHSKSQPDLVGLNQKGDWIVAEAKGRTNGYSSATMTAAKKQTRMLRQINGTLPSLRVAIQAYFSPVLEFAIDDPEDYDEDAEDVSFDVDSALRNYYSFVYASTRLVEETRKVRGREYLFCFIDEIGVSIGIDRQIRELLDSDSPSKNITRTADSIVTMQGKGAEQNTFVFADGLAISLDYRWSPSRMHLDPLWRRGG